MTDNYNGDFNEIKLSQNGCIQLTTTGVNDNGTDIVNPLMLTAEYVNRISKRDLPSMITPPYKGEYNLMANLNGSSA